MSNPKDGGFVKPEYSKELGRLIQLDRHSSQKIKDLEKTQRNKLGIPSLKIRFNNVFGYYIEVTNTHRHKVPDFYIRKQTLVNSERYTIEELKQLEIESNHRKENRILLELKILEELKTKVETHSKLLFELADLVSRIDVFTSLAWLSKSNDYVKPDITENSISVVNLRHPVVELFSEQPFVPNTIKMSRSDVMLITGPNMAGKSTVMRELALCSLLCQIGSYVPASQVEIPIFDGIYTRIGANDLLTEGFSTFMVEMKETANILNTATSKSLLIFDEIGRGTSTFDGMSLAQAILEYLTSDLKATTLFSTHYHELTSRVDGVINKHMGVEETGVGIKFLYTLLSGASGKSYGVEVSKLAGIPKKITSRALEILNKKQYDGLNESTFQAVEKSKAEEIVLKKLKEMINKIDVSNITPLNALVEIDKIKQTIKNDLH